MATGQIEKIEKPIETKKADGRKKNGGTRKGSGRKPILKGVKDYEARERFKLAFDETITYEDLCDIITRSKKDTKLFKELLAQRIGKPAQAIELGGTDGEAIKFIIEKQ